jgi:putative endonuclease
MLARILSWLRRTNTSLGERGERAAARFLRRAGYKIIDRHYRDQFGEIDVIATDCQRLVFVEVKTRRSAQHEHPAESVDRAKQRRLSRTAAAYARRHHLGDTPVRFDIVAVTWPPNVRHPTIEHFPGAFEAVEDIL